MCLGEEKVMSCMASIVITDNTQHLPPEYKGYKKYMIGGAIVTDANFPIDGHWNMMECEIIIIPRKIFTDYIEGDGMMIDQLLTRGFANRDMWKKEVSF